MMQIKQVLLNEPEYPPYLSEIPSPPKQLFVLGDVNIHMPMVAIVGSRNPTSYGESVTYQLAYELAQAGLTIVSGLALGLDGVAHRAALDAGGKTIAVLAHPLPEIYPARHRGLAREILQKGGAIISENPPGTEIFKPTFVARNRIISGLAVATIVTEATDISGTLTTADFALKQNRLVFAVPGNITSDLSAGPNNLLRKGAQPISSSTDVMVALNYVSETAPQIEVTADSPHEARLIELMRTGTTTTQELIEQSGYGASDFANIISLMEITGKVRNLGAGRWLAR